MSGLSNLPPGCSSADIEAQCAPGLVEQYEMAHKDGELAPTWGLTPEQARAALDRIYEDEDVFALVEAIADWHRREGFQEALYEEAIEDNSYA